MQIALSIMTVRDEFHLFSLRSGESPAFGWQVLFLSLQVLCRGRVGWDSEHPGLVEDASTMAGEMESDGL